MHLHRLFPGQKLNVLRSFGVQSGDDKHFLSGKLPNVNSLMYDAGVYTLKFANSKLNHLTINNYIQQLKQYNHQFDYYSNWDSNFTPQGFKENRKSLRKIEAAGLNPFPVIHDYYHREIQFYLAKGYDFLALGGIMNKGSKRKLRTKKDVIYAMSQIPTDLVKVHLFGASSYDMIAHLPFYSCDSSSWALNNRFGFILYWNELLTHKEDKTEKLFFMDKMKDYFCKDRRYWETYHGRNHREEFINNLGFSYYDLMGHRRHHYRQLLNAIYYMTIERVITEKWSVRSQKAA